MTERQLRKRRNLLEREAELAAVDEALAELTETGPGAGPGGGVLAFAGSAGLGKTTLLAEIRRRARERNCTVLSARGGEQERGLAFRVARQLMYPLLSPHSADELTRSLGSWFDIVGPALGLCPPVGVSPDPQGLRDGLDWVLSHLVMTQAPVVLVLDDAHWADNESLSWLASFVHRAEQLPLLVVVAYRPDELPEHARAFREPGGPGQRPRDLGPLTPKAVRQFLREAVGDEADEVFCQELWTLTEGNPFHTVELVAKVADRKLALDESGTSQLRDMAAANQGGHYLGRLKSLGASSRRLAEACAVLGTDVPRSLAARLAPLGAEEAVDATERLVEANILTTASDRGEVRLDFVHPLIATAVYRSIGDSMRVAMHGLAARAVIDAGHGATAAARHLLEVGCEDDPWVVETLRESAAENIRLGAPEAARKQLYRALLEPPADEDRAEVLFELGCASLLTEPHNTVNHFKSALADPHLDRDPDLRQKIITRLAQVLAHSSRHDDASAVLGQEILRTKDARAKLRLQADQFMWDAFRTDEPEAPARSRRLRKLAGALPGNGLTERWIIGMRAWDATLRGEPVETVLGYARRALGDDLSWAQEERGFELPVIVALTFMYADRPGEAEALFASGITEFEKRGWRGAHLAFAYSLLGYIRYRRGDLIKAEGYARDGLRLAGRVGPRTPVHWYAVSILIEVLLARGRVEEAWALAAEHQFGEAYPAAVVFPDSQTVYAELLLARGNTKAAILELEAVGKRLGARGVRNPSWCPWQLHLARAEAGRNPERARFLAEDAVRRAREFGTSSAIGQALRLAHEVTGEGLAEAMEHLAASPAAYELACAQVTLGAEQHVPELLHEGLEGALDCGADGLAATARAALAAVGARPRTPLNGGVELTSREERAARLIAGGEPRAKVAADLSTDETEVSRLLSSVYRKLGTSRAGLHEALPPARG
ncbi:AAA family ATPase [Streptomyces sp. NPDC097619]|uniref:ATP-binding protein n=1 Tax=Streptomyces sp. NPDC097619 TaxID=3157228 RepID=UPI003325A2D2